MSILLKIVEY